jgi:NitT/TauT family transport system ATP-binding protein
MIDARAGSQVELVGVTKSYKNRVVLDTTNLRVAKGEFVTMIGPSGCGKSTVLKLISGLTTPSSGTVRVGNLSRQNVGLGLELDGVSRARRMEKTSSLLQLVGLEQVASAYPRELSGGMKMRVSIARALATKPQLLLMDEPFAALDEMSRDRLNEELLRLRDEQNWTAVFVTHSVAEAVFLSTRIVVLAPNPGRIHAELSVELPFPRIAVLRETPQFEALVGQVSHSLREAIAQ